MFLKDILIFLSVAALCSSQNHDNSHQNKDYSGPYLIYNVLQSLLKLNEARYETLKNLNKLNNGNYLRTSNENDYKNIWKKPNSMVNLLSFKPNLEKNDPNVDYFDVFYDNNYLLTIQSKVDSKDALRIRTKESVSEEDEKLVEDILSDENKTNKDNLRYYLCGRGGLRCYLACKEAYRKSCLERYCEYDFIIEMRNSCRDECEYRFY